MSPQKKITLLWRRLNVFELGKDVVLVPYYLGKALNYQIEICCDYSEDIANQIRKTPKEGLSFIKMKLSHNFILRSFSYANYLRQHASNINILMCFHWRFETFINILLYNFFNKGGQIYIKLDTISGEEWNLSQRSLISKLIRKLLYKNCLQKVNVLSCETSQAYNLLCNNKYFGSQLKEKLVLMPNAFDEGLLKKTKIRERDFCEKENLIITVGRLGISQKNTEMIIEALKEIELKDWKFCFIGTVDRSLEYAINELYKKNPEKREQIYFVGEIKDKEELWGWYNKSKVFVLTSRWESYGLALNEAKRFKNYIISTRVGAAEDIIDKEKYGLFIGQEDSANLANILSQIINKEINIDVYQDYKGEQLSYEDTVQVLLRLLPKNNKLN